MPKMTIYVPDDLHARIEELRKSGMKPNWSEVAARAFESAMAEISRATRSMDNATAVLLRVPTAGDYSFFEVRSGDQQFRVKVSGSAMAGKYRNKLERIVAEFARRSVRGRSIDAGSVLADMLMSHKAHEIDQELKE